MTVVSFFFFTYSYSSLTGWPADFEVNGNWGCCTVCPGSKWTQTKNLRAHAKLARHIASSKRAAVLASRTRSAPPHFLQAVTVEGYVSDDEWEDLIEEPYHLPDENTHQADHDSLNSLSTLVGMFHAEALRVGVSLTGDDLPPDEAFIAFQEALAGTTIVDAALWPHDEEMPSVETDENVEEQDYSQEEGVYLRTVILQINSLILSYSSG